MVKNNEELRFRTPTTEDGPLYPPEPIPRRPDLTNGGKAKGELLILMGVIHDHRRTPVSGAQKVKQLARVLQRLGMSCRARLFRELETAAETTKVMLC